MSIIATELKLYQPETVTNGDSNGGKMSTTEITGGVKNNFFPDTSQAERLAGITRFRKVFAKLTNAANEVLFNPKYHLKSFTPGQDFVELFEGTQINTQVDITGAERKYGAGQLTANQSAGATSFAMTLEDATQDIFEATGNTIYITDGIQEEYFSDVDASVLGDQVTLTLDAGFALANSYVAANTTVASCIAVASTELTPTFEAVAVVTAGDGDYDDGTNPIEGDNIGAIEEVFTLTFTSGTEFDCVGATVGAVGSGNITSDFAPTNTDFARAYFTLRNAGFSGTWAAGDTLTITTHPAAKALWAKQTVPAGTASYSGNNFYLRFAGESA